MGRNSSKFIKLSRPNGKGWLQSQEEAMRGSGFRIFVQQRRRKFINTSKITLELILMILPRPLTLTWRR